MSVEAVKELHQGAQNDHADLESAHFLAVDDVGDVDRTDRHWVSSVFYYFDFKAGQT